MIIPVFLLAFAGGFLVRGVSGPSAGHSDSTAESVDNEPERWTCSMHPQIILPTNNQMCPICNMDLIPLEDDLSSGLARNELSLSPEAAALADLGTSLVQRRFVARRVPLVGEVSADETRLREITARFGGRLDRLYLASTGANVSKGMKLAEIYSPEIYGAQAELQTAVNSLAAAPEGPVADSARRLVESSRKKLRLAGLSASQIQEVETGGQLNENLVVTAPFDGVVISRKATEGQYVKTGMVLYSIADLSRVWVTLRAYERDLIWLRPGQNVEFRTRSHGGLIFKGDILFLDSILDEKTRTVEVRVEVENSDGLLKPGMLVSAEVEAVLDANGNPAQMDEVALPPLVIPASAPLLTGRRAVVYVQKEGQEFPVYQGREVVLGARAGGFYLVEKGLLEGEKVVTRGAFKIDSALQIQAKDSMMMARDGLGYPAENISTPAIIETPEDFKKALIILLDAYLELQSKLAADDNEGSALAGRSVAEAISAAEELSDQLSVSAAIKWSHLYPKLDQALEALEHSETLVTRRVPFQPLSDNLWLVFKTFGTPEDKVLRQFNCPMAFSDTGAEWIQLGKTTNNPYFGDQMLRCGAQVQTLSPASSENKEGH